MTSRGPGHRATSTTTSPMAVMLALPGHHNAQAAAGRPEIPGTRRGRVACQIQDRGGVRG